MGIEDSESIREAVEIARRQPPIADEPKFLWVRDGEVGHPVLVRTPKGEPAFWMVPILVEGHACGFARVGLSGRVGQVGVFGSGLEDRSSWIPAVFFREPPAEIIEDMRNRYPSFSMSEAVLSYDESPGKWAWRVELWLVNELKVTIFITPGGWYERKPEGKRKGLEG